MTELTYDARWVIGFPPDGAERCWLGESADGRQWLMRWSEKFRYWCLSGFAADFDNFPSPEIWKLANPNSHTTLQIVRHMALPSTMIEEDS